MIRQLRNRIARAFFQPTNIATNHFGTMPQYPGLGLPLRHFHQDGKMYPMGIHGNFFNADSNILPVREVAMMIIMDRLTDKPDWHRKVFDDEIVARWCKEALEYPDDSLWKQATGGKGRRRLATQNQYDFDWATSHINPLEGIMTNAAFDYVSSAEWKGLRRLAKWKKCVQELRTKARYYEKSGLIPTLDACATIVKSDNLVSPELQVELRNGFARLKADQMASPDWHPNSRDMVQDLVHPSMYPLVYGRSRVFEKEVVRVDDAIDKWAGKGEVIEKNDDPTDNFGYGIGGGSIPPNFWSGTYQWLPSNVAFRDDGSVRFTSYINNLHPNKYADIYRTIEKLVERALPAWDQCLALSVKYQKIPGVGRTDSRFSMPDNPE